MGYSFTHRLMTQEEKDFYFKSASKYIMRIKDEAYREEVIALFKKNRIGIEGIYSNSIDEKTLNYLNAWNKKGHVKDMMAAVFTAMEKGQVPAATLANIIAIVCNPNYYCYLESFYDAMVGFKQRDKVYCEWIEFILEKVENKIAKEDEKLAQRGDVTKAELERQQSRKNWVAYAKKTNLKHKGDALEFIEKQKAKERRYYQRLQAQEEMKRDQFAESDFTNTTSEYDDFMDKLKRDEERSRREYYDTQELLEAAYCVFF